MAIVVFFFVFSFLTFLFNYVLYQQSPILSLCCCCSPFSYPSFSRSQLLQSSHRILGLPRLISRPIYGCLVSLPVPSNHPSKCRNSHRYKLQCIGADKINSYKLPRSLSTDLFNLDVQRLDNMRVNEAPVYFLDDLIRNYFVDAYTICSISNIIGDVVLNYFLFLFQRKLFSVLSIRVAALQRYVVHGHVVTSDLRDERKVKSAEG